jgi:hypothetical protein
VCGGRPGRAAVYDASAARALDEANRSTRQPVPPPDCARAFGLRCWVVADDDYLAEDVAEGFVELFPLGSLAAPFAKRLFRAIRREHDQRVSIALRAAERVSGRSREEGPPTSLLPIPGCRKRRHASAWRH